MLASLERNENRVVMLAAPDVLHGLQKKLPEIACLRQRIIKNNVHVKC